MDTDLVRTGSCQLDSSEHNSNEQSNFQQQQQLKHAQGRDDGKGEKLIILLLN
jgi:hypothetical protein